MGISKQSDDGQSIDLTVARRRLPTSWDANTMMTSVESLPHHSDPPPRSDSLSTNGSSSSRSSGPSAYAARELSPEVDDAIAYEEEFELIRRLSSLRALVI